MPCEWCTDPDGKPCYPQYGLAPHDHVINSEKRHRRIEYRSEDEWPENFTPDPDCPGMGNWHCPKCGSGREMSPGVFQQ